MESFFRKKNTNEKYNLNLNKGEGDALSSVRSTYDASHWFLCENLLSSAILLL